MTRTTRQRDHSWRAAFTLVELLVVIAIISVLATMVLFALYGVLEDTRAIATRSTISRINAFVLDKWDEYQSRPVSIRFVNGSPLTETEYRRLGGANYGHFVSYARLAAIRELMRMELPNHKSDLMTPGEIGIAATPAVIAAANPRTNLADPRITAPQYRVQLDSIPGLWFAYRAKAASLAGANWLTAWTEEHETAECLYLILSMMDDGERSVLSSIGAGEIGDLDNDGMPEILDAWKAPIVFLRWPAGFTEQAASPAFPYSDLLHTDHEDPFDPLYADLRWPPVDNDANNDPFELVPLILSAGKDKIYDQLLKFIPGSPPSVYYATRLPSSGFAVPNDPFFEVRGTGGQRAFFGSVTGSAADDNITNHYVEVNSP